MTDFGLRHVEEHPFEKGERVGVAADVAREVGGSQYVDAEFGKP